MCWGPAFKLLDQCKEGALSPTTEQYEVLHDIIVNKKDVLNIAGEDDDSELDHFYGLSKEQCKADLPGVSRLSAVFEPSSIHKRKEVCQGCI